VITREIQKFLVVGGICALIDIGIMQSLILLSIDYKLAATAGFATGLLLNYFLHTKLTFKNSISTKNAIRFVVVVFINYGLTLGLIFVSQMWLGQALIGKLISLPLVAVNGFLLSKFWVYR
jgi:putative flippase GtrA